MLVLCISSVFFLLRDLTLLLSSGLLSWQKPSCTLKGEPLKGVTYPLCWSVWLWLNAGMNKSSESAGTTAHGTNQSDKIPNPLPNGEPSPWHHTCNKDLWIDRGADSALIKISSDWISPRTTQHRDSLHSGLGVITATVSQSSVHSWQKRP